MDHEAVSWRAIETKKQQASLAVACHEGRQTPPQYLSLVIFESHKFVVYRRSIQSIRTILFLLQVILPEVSNGRSE